jgi:hypothetical protein
MLTLGWHPSPEERMAAMGPGNQVMAGLGTRGNFAGEPHARPLSGGALAPG